MSRSVFTLHQLALFHLFFYLCPVLVSRFFGDLFSGQLDKVAGAIDNAVGQVLGGLRSGTVVH